MEKQYIGELKKFVTGKMSCSDFEAVQAQYPELWQWLQSLLTEDMVNDTKHEFWSKCHSRLALESNGFRVRETATAFGFDDLLGKMRMHDIISSLMETQFPEIVRKNPPNYSKYDLLLSIGLDCIGGKDADVIVNEILDSIPTDVALSIRRREAKLALKKKFMIDRKKPSWVQEPEWPVVNGHPLRFVGQRHDGELFLYEFINDSDKTITTIEQLS